MGKRKKLIRYTVKGLYPLIRKHAPDRLVFDWPWRGRRVSGMKQILVMIAVVLVGCGKSKEEQKAAEDKAAAEKKTVAATKGVQCRFCENIFPATDIRTHELKCPKNATDQSLKPANHPEPNPKQPKTTSEKLIADPIVEKAIRKQLMSPPIFEKPTGNLTEADLEKVTSLRLNNTSITDAGLKELPKLKNLTYTLNLSFTQITDASIKDLAKLQQLRNLFLNNTSITEAGVAELKKALPNCIIYVGL
jgi:hypothetical protein